MVDADYLRQFRNEEVLKNLQSIPLARLDDLQAQYLQQLGKTFEEWREQEADEIIRRTREVDLFQRRSPPVVYSEEKVAVLFGMIKENTDQILGKEEIEICNLSPLRNDQECSSYDISTKTISIHPYHRANIHRLAEALAHEYGHHLLTVSLLCPYPDFEFFHEGYAIGIQRLVPQTMTESKTGQDIFQKRAVRTTLTHFEGKEFIWDRMSTRGIESITKGTGIQIWRHNLGSILFALLEAERGPDIYRQILHGEFKW